MFLVDLNFSGFILLQSKVLVIRLVNMQFKIPIGKKKVESIVSVEANIGKKSWCPFHKASQPER